VVIDLSPDEELFTVDQTSAQPVQAGQRSVKPQSRQPPTWLVTSTENLLRRWHGWIYPGREDDPSHRGLWKTGIDNLLSAQVVTDGQLQPQTPKNIPIMAQGLRGGEQLALSSRWSIACIHSCCLECCSIAREAKTVLHPFERLHGY